LIPPADSLSLYQLIKIGNPVMAIAASIMTANIKTKTKRPSLHSCSKNHARVLNHDCVRGLVSVPVLLIGLLHGKISNQAEAQGIDKVAELSNDGRPQSAAQAVFPNYYHAEQPLAQCASAHAHANHVISGKANHASNESCEGMPKP
jgi:hypothetical protein